MINPIRTHHSVRTGLPPYHPDTHHSVKTYYPINDHSVKTGSLMIKLYSIHQYPHPDTAYLFLVSFQLMQLLSALLISEPDFLLKKEDVPAIQAGSVSIYTHTKDTHSPLQFLCVGLHLLVSGPVGILPYAPQVLLKVLSSIIMPPVASHSATHTPYPLAATSLDLSQPHP